MIQLIGILAGIALLIGVAISRRGQCAWSADKVRTYRTMSILGLLFAPGVIATRSPLGWLALAVTGASIYSLTMAVCRSRDLKRTERAREATA